MTEHVSYLLQAVAQILFLLAATHELHEYLKEGLTWEE